LILLKLIAELILLKISKYMNISMLANMFGRQKYIFFLHNKELIWRNKIFMCYFAPNFWDL